MAAITRKADSRASNGSPRTTTTEPLFTESPDSDGFDDAGTGETPGGNNGSPVDRDTEGRVPYRKMWVAISPAKAKAMLEELHPDQRHKRDTRIEQYAQDMARGHWREDTEDTILFDWDGHLIDGQNRLNAVIEANTTIHFWVVWGVDPKVMSVKDTGASRNIADSLKIAGLGTGMTAPELKVVGAIARRQIFWEAGRHSASATRGVVKATHSDVAAILANQPDIYGAAKVGVDASRTTRPPLVAATIYGFFWLNANRVDSDAAYRWQSFWLTPSDLPGGSPIAVVRERFMRSAMADHAAQFANHRADVLSSDEKLALLIRAWNYFLANRQATPSRLHIARGKLNNDNFPQFLTPDEASEMAAKAEYDVKRYQSGAPRNSAAKGRRQTA